MPLPNFSVMFAHFAVHAVPLTSCWLILITFRCPSANQLPPTIFVEQSRSVTDSNAITFRLGLVILVSKKHSSSLKSKRTHLFSVTLSSLSSCFVDSRTYRGRVCVCACVCVRVKPVSKEVFCTSLSLRTKMEEAEGNDSPT